MSTPDRSKAGASPGRSSSQIWPNKRFWSNINIGKYQLPPDKLRQAVLEGVAEGAVNGSLFAYEISEDMPANWETAIPVVLDALNETRR